MNRDGEVQSRFDLAVKRGEYLHSLGIHSVRRQNHSVREQPPNGGFVVKGCHDGHAIPLRGVEKGLLHAPHLAGGAGEEGLIKEHLGKRATTEPQRFQAASAQEARGEQAVRYGKMGRSEP